MDISGWALWAPEFEKLGLAFLLGLPIGFEREEQSEAAGLRTFPLVSVGSCALILIVMDSGFNQDGVTRALQGLLAGVGFIGGGAIMRQGATVHGTATAASLWNVAAIGVAVAMRHYAIAAILMVLNLIALHVLLPLKRRLARK